MQIALLNNRTLQATFEDLGVAQAEFVQAGLLKNPVPDPSEMTDFNVLRSTEKRFR